MRIVTEQDFWALLKLSVIKMAQITSGIRSILSNPVMYSFFQKVMGADLHAQRLVDKYIRPESGMAVLDIGCGTADILAFLPPVDYWGFDISSSYIVHAKNKYSHRGQHFCKLLTGADLATMPRFDIVLLMGVLHHLDDGMAKEMVSIAHQSLKPKGRLVTVDPCHAPKQNPFARFLIAQDRGQNVRDEIGYRQIVTDVFSEIRVDIKHQAWIPYTHCIMECIK